MSRTRQRPDRRATAEQRRLGGLLAAEVRARRERLAAAAHLFVVPPGFRRGQAGDTVQLVYVSADGTETVAFERVLEPEDGAA